MLVRCLFFCRVEEMTLADVPIFFGSVWLFATRVAVLGLVSLSLEITGEAARWSVYEKAVTPKRTHQSVAPRLVSVLCYGSVDEALHTVSTVMAVVDTVGTAIGTTAMRPHKWRGHFSLPCGRWSLQLCHLFLTSDVSSMADVQYDAKINEEDERVEEPVTTN